MSPYAIVYTYLFGKTKMARKPNVLVFPRLFRYFIGKAGLKPWKRQSLRENNILGDFV